MNNSGSLINSPQGNQVGRICFNVQAAPIWVTRLKIVSWRINITLFCAYSRTWGTNQMLQRQCKSLRLHLGLKLGLHLAERCHELPSHFFFVIDSSSWSLICWVSCWNSSGGSEEELRNIHGADPKYCLMVTPAPVAQTRPGCSGRPIAAVRTSWRPWGTKPVDLTSWVEEDVPAKVTKLCLSIVRWLLELVFQWER